MRVSLYLKLLPLYIGLAALVASPFYLSHKRNLAIQTVAAEARSHIEQNSDDGVVPIKGTPVRIVLPAQGIDLPIVKGSYDTANRTWSVARRTANYATNTYAANNESGTTLIYGHNNKYVLGKTKSIQKGDVAIIYTDNGHILQYSFVDEMVVDPTDTQIFSQLDGQPKLQLLTCGGSWSENRRIMSFKLESGV